MSIEHAPVPELAHGIGHGINTHLLVQAGILAIAAVVGWKVFKNIVGMK